MDIEEMDVPVMVCLEHGRFVPCRSKDGHRYSTDPRDVELVRYHQQVTVRMQRAPAPPPPAYREVDIPAALWTFSPGEEYGSVMLYCDGRVLSDSRVNGHRYLINCRHTFNADNVKELTDEIDRHITDTKHYEQVPG